MAFTRRDFLKAGACASLGAMFVPRVFANAAEALTPAADQYLIVLQLSGGNDGSNTLIPFEDENYYRSRPILAQKKNEVLTLSGSGAAGLALHPRMKAMRELYDQGLVAIVPGVGYPNPNRSHFRSMDIWHTARPADTRADSGWLGRCLCAQAGGLHALHIGENSLPLALVGKVAVPSLQNIDFLDFMAGSDGEKIRGVVRSLNRAERQGEPEIVRQRAESALLDLERLLVIRGNKPPVDYPESGLGKKLKLTGQLIQADFPSRILYLSQDGYDTHARQQEVHAALLDELSQALAAFFKHLEHASAASRVTVIVFSEFGRRVKENGSFGTDHGAAAPVFLLSGRIQGGVAGKYPSLTDLDDGDLRHAVDFRALYATILTEVLQLEPARILGDTFERLPIFRS